MIGTNEAGKRLGVSDRRVRAMIAAGILPAKRQGRGLVVPESAVEYRIKHPGRTGRPRLIDVLLR